MGVSPQTHVRSANADDLDLLFSMIEGLADYEQAGARVVGTPQQLRAALFGPDPAAEASIAELDGEPAGCAIFYRSFSTWECMPGIWLEDLYVLPQFRRRASTSEPGVGETLLRHLALLTVERGYTRLEWTALNWNEPALSFYRKHNAQVMDDWLMHRLDGESLQRAAGADGNI